METEKEILQKLVNESSSLSDVLRKQNKAISGSSINILKDKLKEYNIEYNFLNIHDIRKKLSNEEMFTNNSNRTSKNLKDRIIKEKLKPYVCSICGNPPEWNGKPLVLQLDHINGNHYDNRLENLRFVCPNCHSQTDTFGTKRFKNVNFCVDCGTVISNRAKRCHNCSIKYRIETKRTDQELNMLVSKEELLNLVLKNSFSDIGKIYNVSDNCVRKWCKKYGLPYSKKTLREYLKNN
jgi:rubrerythrin